MVYYMNESSPGISEHLLSSFGRFRFEGVRFDFHLLVVNLLGRVEDELSRHVLLEAFLDVLLEHSE